MFRMESKQDIRFAEAIVYFIIFAPLKKGFVVKYDQ